MTDTPPATSLGSTSHASGACGGRGAFAGREGRKERGISIHAEPRRKRGAVLRRPGRGPASLPRALLTTWFALFRWFPRAWLLSCPAPPGQHRGHARYHAWKAGPCASLAPCLSHSGCDALTTCGLTRAGAQVGEVRSLRSTCRQAPRGHRACDKRERWQGGTQLSHRGRVEGRGSGGRRKEDLQQTAFGKDNTPVAEHCLAWSQLTVH